MYGTFFGQERRGESVGIICTPCVRSDLGARVEGVSACRVSCDGSDRSVPVLARVCVSLASVYTWRPLPIADCANPNRGCARWPAPPTAASASSSQARAPHWLPSQCPGRASRATRRPTQRPTASGRSAAARRSSASKGFGRNSAHIWYARCPHGPVSLSHAFSVEPEVVSSILNVSLAAG